MGSNGVFSLSEPFLCDVVLVWRRKLSGLGRHYGVALLDAFGNVISVNDLTNKNEIRLLSLDEFCEGRRAQWGHSCGRDGLAAALERLDQARLDPQVACFHLADWNCETFARWVVTGYGESKQVNDAVVAGLVGLALYAFK